MHRSLGPTILACLLTTVALVVAPLSAQNKLYTFPGSAAEKRVLHSSVTSRIKSCAGFELAASRDWWVAPGSSGRDFLPDTRMGGC